MPLTGEQRESIYRLVHNEPKYEPFFESLAGLGRNTHDFSLSVVQSRSGLNEQLSRKLMHDIEAKTGLAKVQGGGNGVQHFLAWKEDVDVREVGRSYREPLR
jgi:hypothetical protein